MKRGLFLLGVVASLVLLAGCRISIDRGPVFPDAEPVSVSTNAEQSLSRVTLGAGQSIEYELRLGDSQRARQALYIELDNDLDLYVYNSSGGLYATSSSADFFASGEAGLQSLAAAASEFQPAEVRTTQTCRGSCVIRDANSDRFFVRVRNTTGSSQSFNLFAYAGDYQDTGEPGNDTVAGATRIPFGVTERGAIESLGDVDYFRPGAEGVLTFDSSAKVPVRARVIDASRGGRSFDLVAGEPFTVFSDDVIEVFVDGDNRAAVTFNSLYFLTLD